MMRLRVWTLILMGIVLAGCGLVNAEQEVLVRENEVAVVYNTETQQLEAPLLPGVYTIDPLTQRVTFYPTFVQNYTFAGNDETMDTATGSPAIVAQTADGAVVSISVSVIFRINPEKVNRIHQDWFGTPGDYRAGYVRPTTRLLVRTIVSTYTLAGLTALSPGELAVRITTPLRPELEDSGFFLERIDVLRVAVVS